MMSCKNSLAIAFLLPLLISGKSPKSSFYETVVKKQGVLREACAYLLKTKGFSRGSASGVEDLIPAGRVRDELKKMRVATIYILKSRYYNWPFPEDSTIVFKKSSFWWKNEREELLAITYSSATNTMEIGKTVEDNDLQTVLQRVSDKMYYYSY